MIIKSMSRKTATFSALVAYVGRVQAADHKFALRHNMFADNPDATVAAFEANGRLLKARKNGVVMYHEIISITRSKGLDMDAQKQALRRIALDYVQKRAPRCMAYGMLHDDHSHHLHYHLVISANEHGENRRHSLTRQQFRQVQLDMEKHVLANFPELQQKVAMGKRAGAKQSQAGAEMKRRTGRKPQIDVLVFRATSIFAAAQNSEQLFKLLTDARLELYTRGKAIGLTDLEHGRNHRLETLGLLPAYQRMHDRISQSKAQKLAPDVHAPAASRPTQTGASPDMAIIPTPSVEGLKTRAARAARRALERAERIVGAIAQEGGAIANQVVGGTAKHATGMIETAVHTIGGPKPHASTTQSQPQANAVPQKVGDVAKAAAIPFNPNAELERLAAERKKELERLQNEALEKQLRHEGLPGPKQSL